INPAPRLSRGDMLSPCPPDTCPPGSSLSESPSVAVQQDEGAMRPALVASAALERLLDGLRVGVEGEGQPGAAARAAREGDAQTPRYRGGRGRLRGDFADRHGEDGDRPLAWLEAEPERIRLPRQVISLGAGEGDRRLVGDVPVAHGLPDEAGGGGGGTPAEGARRPAGASVLVRDVVDDEGGGLGATGGGGLDSRGV